MNTNNLKNELYPCALTIAGSDSGGGAGIQADLRTFNAFGVYGCTAITAVTSQNPKHVTRIDGIPPEGVTSQIDAIIEEIQLSWVKTGMLFSPEIVTAVAKAVKKYKLQLILDPVMVSTSGSVLLKDSAIQALKTELMPLANWITPNIPEAELLLNCKLKSEQDYFNAAQKCSEQWGVSVLLKSGHAPGGKFACDVVAHSGNLYRLTSRRLPDQGQSHGTGCTLSAAMTAGFALGMPWKTVLCEAKAFVFGSLSECVKIGDGVLAMYPPVEDRVDQIRLEKV
ncbi:MAG: bifunctional hydroxymethylpyrimidine kinase/phosphomethylpyrimidine kinase [Victivallales bacterium]|nr:bifunctional hydroxymethylpyrimidine kinase/phosphomethylpyrimidine kinase [Victivallales bacterium]